MYLRSCLQGGGRVSDCVYRMVGVSQGVFTEWWACLGSCLQVVGVFAWWWECLRSCSLGGGSVSGHVRMVVDVSQVMFA